MSQNAIQLSETAFEDLFLTIKYEGPSFNWVMNIHDLWNELIWLEYCLKSILKEIYKLEKKELKSEELKTLLKDFDISQLEIITEGFVNNCFLKKIKFWNKEDDRNKLIQLFDWIENRPELMSFLKFLIRSGLTVFTVTYTAQLTLDSDALKIALQNNTIPQEAIKSIWEADLNSSGKKVALEMMWDPKYREASAKTIIPIKDSNDSLELSSPIIEKPLKINHSSKDNFLINTKLHDEQDTEYQKYDLIYWRINSIDLDAKKNQIWFKVMNEWTEINCHLSDELDINNYKEWYLWEWVEIEWMIHYSQDTTKYIEIKKISKVTIPISEASQLSLSDK